MPNCPAGRMTWPLAAKIREAEARPRTAATVAVIHYLYEPGFGSP
jgi:hypothetical protein